MNKTNRTAADLKIACLEEALKDALRQYWESGESKAKGLRVWAIRQEMADVRAGR